MPLVFLMQFLICCCHTSISASLKLWSADHEWSSGSALVVLLDWTLVQKKTEKIKLTWIAYHTLKLRISNWVWKLHTTSIFKLSLPGLTFYEIYYPTYSTLNNKRGIFCCKNMFWTLFRAGLLCLIIPRVGWSVEHSD